MIPPISKWTYPKDHGEDYPVQVNDHWRIAGHDYHCHDLEATSTWATIVAQRQPKMAYTDPPWNSGNAKSFRTKAGVDGPTGRDVDIQQLLTAILTPLRDLKILAYVETGLRDEKGLSTLVTTLGGVTSGVWQITYYGRRPCVVIAADFRDTPNEDHPNLKGMDDEDTPLAVFQHHLATGTLQPGDLIVDPCAGRGLTAYSAQRAGLLALTNELHPNRVSSALAKVAKATKHQPERQSS